MVLARAKWLWLFGLWRLLDVAIEIQILKLVRFSGFGNLKLVRQWRVENVNLRDFCLLP